MRLWQKYALALAAVAIIPLGVTAWQIARHDAGELSRSVREYQLATAEVALGAIRGLVDRGVSEARTVGAALAQPGTSSEARERAAEAHLIGAEVLDNLTLYRPSGELVFSMRAPRAGEAGTPPPPTLGEDARRIAEDAGRVIGAVLAREDGVPVAPVILPVRDPEGAIYAFAWSAISLAELAAVVADLSARRFGGATELVRIVDERLRVIAAADPEAMWQSLAGVGPLEGVTTGATLRRDVAHTTTYRNPEGKELIAAVVPLPELGWGVVVEEYEEVAFAGVARLWRMAILLGSGFAVVALLLGVFAARRMAAPVVAISDAAQKVAGGDFSVRVGVAGRDEIGDMARAFNGMASDLGDYRDKLIEETRVRGNLSRFLSPDVVESVVVGSEELRLGGERREITVMFADVVAFSELVEERPPEYVVALLNELFTIITEIVFKHGGIIDKFIGDCAMAIWGAPREHGDSAMRAVRAAEEILRWLEVGNAKWRKELGRDIELAIGIHTGTAVVGNIGSEKRMEYTAIGEAVNVAARLERLARPGQILVTKSTMTHVSDEFDGVSLGDVGIIGRSRTSEIFVLED